MKKPDSPIVLASAELTPELLQALSIADGTADANRVVLDSVVFMYLHYGNFSNPLVFIWPFQYHIDNAFLADVREVQHYDG